ncbi:MAG: tyrosine decarboxylase, partial [Bifidobacteriaceae bacterium]|jgi:glutamate/tyrosine decarboxylase-like PLP-dependent enzyme|nr:tyrosine decarboxylase [Bifidobacteriaceae bacterium]
MFWRRDYFPADAPELTASDRQQPDFRATVDTTNQVLHDLSTRLKDRSLPWFSPRYLGHMTADTLMVANAAYIMTMLYNTNNVADEASPATTQLELEVGADLARMFGYDTRRSWGHVTSGGHTANYEAMWVARNLKSMPLAIAAHAAASQLVAGKSWSDLLAMSVADILDLTDELKQRNLFAEVRALSARGVGVNPTDLGKLLVPRSRHYSWDKAADVLGIGQANLVPVDVDEHCRMDMAVLTRLVEGFIAAGTPILAVMGVVGSTEEGAVDPIDAIVALRQRCEQRHGVSFYIHADAAFGGYLAASLVGDDDQVMGLEELRSRYAKDELFPADGASWPKPEVYEAFRALSQVDSITVDPHKMGYVPYAAGGVVMRDRRILDLISYEATYLVQSFAKEPDLAAPMELGSVIIEGSKSGAAAAAVWAAHQVAPLTIGGFGRIVTRCVGAADWFCSQLSQAPEFQVEGRRFTVRPIMDPDTNMVDFSFLDLDDASLAAHNRLNERVYDLSSFVSGRAYGHGFNTSQTRLTRAAYGDTPRRLAQQRGIDTADWDTVGELAMLRSTVMTMALSDQARLERYWAELLEIWRRDLAAIVDGDLVAGVKSAAASGR